jgi:uncharacterized protein DUF2817
MTPSAKNCFSASYADARALFLRSATEAGGALSAHTHPTATGVAGEPLQIDVAAFGTAGAPKVFVIVSGTHGMEGYAGSAAQIAFIRSGRLRALPPDILVLMVHGLNPWGFSHGSRTTENNVDLNRNFIDWRGAPPANPAYAELHPMLCPRDWTRASRDRADAQIAGWIAKHSRSTFLDRMIRGQHEFADGIAYGGQGPEWSNVTLKEIVRNGCRGAKRVAVIDWHTGLGAPGEPFYLCFNRPGSALERRCLDWWGQKSSTGFSEGQERPAYTGLVYQGIESLLSSQAEVAGGVVEFGTRPVNDMIDALRIDRWLRFAAPGAAADHSRDALIADLMERYCPAAETWRTRVLAHAAHLHGNTLNGLIAWT